MKLSNWSFKNSNMVLTNIDTDVYTNKRAIYHIYIYNASDLNQSKSKGLHPLSMLKLWVYMIIYAKSFSGS